MALEAALDPGTEAGAADEAGGGASRDELVGMLRGWAAIESWASTGRLAVLRALIADEAKDEAGQRPGDGGPGDGGPGAGHPRRVSRQGECAEGWSKSLACEVAAALAVSVPTADSMLWLAGDLHERLPGVLGLLAGGELTYAKARAVDEAMQLLGQDDSARAEALILPGLPGKNYGQVKRLAEQAAVTVDPGAAARRRDDAEREKARVTLYREDSGAAALSGGDLPAAQALAAHERVCDRAAQYKDSGAFPATRMDQLRAAAYLDLLNDVTAEERVASGVLPASSTAEPASPRGAEAQEADQDGPDGQPGGLEPVGGPGGCGPAGGGPEIGAGLRPEGRQGSAPVPAPAPPARLTDLVVPLATLLGLAERPGEGHRLGPLDPALCRPLAALAASSPHTMVCVTVTDRDGIAIGHGCARPARRRKPAEQPPGRAAPDQPGWPSPGHGLPARLNLTINASRLATLTGPVRPPGPPGRRRPWAFEPLRPPGTGTGTGPPGASGAEPPGAFGTWILTLPGGRQLTVELDDVPTYACDHRHESAAYQPGARLRHLVQVRDGDCTFPPCTRHARESDFEHAVPYDQGGRTCACNAGARSRQCHRVKQSPGWEVTQPRPGWHQWTTPAGRVYTQGPKRYPS